jgi:hypothetical protein
MRLEKNYLEEMRLKGDPEADRVIELAFDRKKEHILYGLLGAGPPQGEFSRDNFIAEFLARQPLIPNWHDAERLQKGQRFFKKFGLEIMTLLGALALPYCYAASPGNKALYFTGKMQHSPGKRLHDTAHFIIKVMEEGSFLPGGSGAFEVQRTRLIHALVRHHVSAQPEWDLAWGVPVNQEDMAGTNLAFSHIVLKGLDKLNFQITDPEKEDFLFAWRFIGHQLCIDPGLLPQSLAESRQLEKIIKARHFKLSDEAKLLMRELLQHYRESFPAPAGYLIESQVRYFVGPEVAVLLGLKKHLIRDRIVTGINQLQQRINKRFVNPHSYDIMIKNHNEQKNRYR